MNKIDKKLVLDYYSRRDIREELVRLARNREVGIRYMDDKFGKRPQILINEGDIIEKVKKGAISFHFSIERWLNPMLLSTNTKLEDIRIGWDLVFDIDCSNLFYSKITADLIIKELESYDIKNFFVKFSGNTGFHIILPFETFPEYYKGKNILEAFPEAGREVIEYIKSKIREKLKDLLLKLDGNVHRIIEKCGYNPNDFEYLNEENFDPFDFIKIDSQAISPRHLIRMPYSINEKSGLVSIPINKNVLKFEVETAIPDNVEVSEGFLSINDKTYEAKNLFEDAEIYIRKSYNRVIRKSIENIKTFLKSKNIKKVPFDYFPPCIKNILKGLTDGKKRALFVLMTFLKKVGYSNEEIEDIIWKWNEKNNPKLRESYIKSQLKWFFKLNRDYLPPNCDNEIYIKEIGICEPDEICRRFNIKNPLVYVSKSIKLWRKKEKKE